MIKSKYFFIATFFLIILQMTEVKADIMIAPTRVVFEGSDRSSEIVLVNRSTNEFAFRVSLENRRMLQNGSLELAPEATEDELFASNLVRYSPRRIILNPGEKQTIRISANASGLEPGEYRSHLRLMSAPTSAGKKLGELIQQESDGISIELVAVRSITIPVILRVGSLEASVEMGRVRTERSDNEGETILVARMSRSGTKSTYGDIHLYVGTEDKPVFIARGIAIYTPNQDRDVYLPVPNNVLQALSGKNIRIAYVSSDSSSERTIAETTTSLSVN
ncbi:MAG: hypothetical protein MRY72_01015 [Aquisalinus sp.]|nr:hypothetical protein [Aquisalinus sp.]